VLCGRLRLQGSQVVGFVCRTLGCGLDTRNLISQADSEDVHAQPNGMSNPYYPMPVLAIPRVPYGWSIRIRHDERVRYLLGEVISLAGTKGRFIGVITTSGSSRVSSLTKVLPFVTSRPVWYVMENKRVGMKSGGTTPGTVDSSGDVMVQLQ